MKPIDRLSDEELGQRVLRAAELPDAPPALVRSAIALWPAAQPSVVQTALRRVVAALSFDSWAGGPLALGGTRALASATRHLLFSTLGLDIDLRISPDGDRFVLTGQILGPFESGTIELGAAPVDGAPAGPPRRTQLDAFGEFRIEGVSGGRHVLTLQVADELIELPSIDVGEAPR